MLKSAMFENTYCSGRYYFLTGQSGSTVWPRKELSKSNLFLLVTLLLLLL